MTGGVTSSLVTGRYPVRDAESEVIVMAGLVSRFVMQKEITRYLFRFACARWRRTLVATDSLKFSV